MRYHKETFLCPCGREHTNPIDEIVIEEGALQELSRAPARLGLGRRAMLITDEAVMGILGEELVRQLELAECSVRTLIYPLPVYPDERRIFSFLRTYSPEIDFFVAAGTGVINDITRYLSGKLGKPYLSVPTAPSMDGYSAQVALLVIDGVKQTLDAVYPRAVYADTHFLKGAPKRLLAAGVGDLAAKITACGDWRISSIVNGEYCCQDSIRKILRIVDASLELAPRLAEQDEAAVRSLMDGLMFSGVVMHWVGSSRPAAGAEHHITHFWGMWPECPHHLHGIEVAVGTRIMLEVYRRILALDFSRVDAAARARAMPDEAAWRAQIQEVFGEQAPVIFEQQRGKTFDRVQIQQRVQRTVEHEAEIKAVLAEMVPYAEPLRRALQELGAPMNAADLGISPEMLRKGLLYAKEMRPKFVILDVADDLGILQELASEIPASL